MARIENNLKLAKWANDEQKQTEIKIKKLNLNRNRWKCFRKRKEKFGEIKMVGWSCKVQSFKWKKNQRKFIFRKMKTEHLKSNKNNLTTVDWLVDVYFLFFVKKSFYRKQKF